MPLTAVADGNISGRVLHKVAVRRRRRVEVAAGGVADGVAESDAPFGRAGLNGQTSSARLGALEGAAILLVNVKGSVKRCE